MPAMSFLSALQKGRHHSQPKAGPSVILGLRIHEVSLVDDPASEGARIVLHKRARRPASDFATAMAALAPSPAAQPITKATTPPLGASQAKAAPHGAQHPTMPSQPSQAAPESALVTAARSHAASWASRMAVQGLRRGA